MSGVEVAASIVVVCFFGAMSVDKCDYMNATSPFKAFGDVNPDSDTKVHVHVCVKP